MKKIIFTLVCVLLLQLAQAKVTFLSQGVTYNFIDEDYKYKGLYVSGYRDDIQDSIIIEDSFKWQDRYYKVCEIGIDAFLGCSSLKSVIIPNTITTISYNAFEDCTGLISVDIPNSVTSIKPSAFSGCTSLTSVKIPESVTIISGQMFQNCKSLTSVNIPNSVVRIANEAFSGCSLTEVVLPPSVERIAIKAFADNPDLTTVIMGHKVTYIDENAFNGCPVTKVYITALTPPTAFDTSFSSYTGQLELANNNAFSAYHDALFCWNRFSTYNSMIELEEITIDGAQTINATPGDTIRLTATISPENVTLPQIFWRSTNSAIATVDNNGVVVVRGCSTSEDCCIIAESLYADAPTAMVTINSELADIEDIVIDSPDGDQSIDLSAPYEVYNMQGVWLGRSMDSVAPGLYILRQGAKVAKILK